MLCVHACLPDPSLHPTSSLTSRQHMKGVLLVPWTGPSLPQSDVKNISHWLLPAHSMVDNYVVRSVTGGSLWTSSQQGLAC